MKTLPKENKKVHCFCRGSKANVQIGIHQGESTDIENGRVLHKPVGHVAKLYIYHPLRINIQQSTGRHKRFFAWIYWSFPYPGCLLFSLTCVYDAIGICSGKGPQQNHFLVGNWHFCSVLGEIVLICSFLIFELVSDLAVVIRIQFLICRPSRENVMVEIVKNTQMQSIWQTEQTLKKKKTLPDINILWPPLDFF